MTFILSLIRIQQPASYVNSQNNDLATQNGYSHFTLQLPLYTHASSPIRRYNDIVIQRLIHAALSDGSFHLSSTDVTLYDFAM